MIQDWFDSVVENVIVGISYLSVLPSPPASSGRRTRSRGDIQFRTQQQPRRARPKARRPEARMVVLEHPPIISEIDNEEDPRQQGEVHVHVHLSL